MSERRMGTSQRVRETDCEFLHRILSDGQPHNLNELLRQSMFDRGCGLTVHSRIAELRSKHGLDITNWKTGTRGDGSWYRLLLKESPAATESADDSLSGTEQQADPPSCLPENGAAQQLCLPVAA